MYWSGWFFSVLYISTLYILLREFRPYCDSCINSVTWHTCNPTGWADCRCFKNLFSSPSLLSTPSVADPSLRALLKQPDDLTSSLLSISDPRHLRGTIGTFWGIALHCKRSGKEAPSPRNCFLPHYCFFHFFQEDLVLQSSCFLGIAFFFFIFNYSGIVLYGQFLRAQGTNVKTTTEPTISSSSSHPSSGIK